MQDQPTIKRAGSLDPIDTNVQPERRNPMHGIMARHVNPYLPSQPEFPAIR